MSGSRRTLYNDYIQLYDRWDSFLLPLHKKDFFLQELQCFQQRTHLKSLVQKEAVASKILAYVNPLSNNISVIREYSKFQ